MVAHRRVERFPDPIYSCTLADLIRRTIFPINTITVKIASIEHRSQFNFLESHGQYTGMELGADISADLNLDDFLVFENNQAKAVEFFKSLIFKHYQSEDTSGEISSPDQLSTPRGVYATSRLRGVRTGGRGSSPRCIESDRQSSYEEFRTKNSDERCPRGRAGLVSAGQSERYPGKRDMKSDLLQHIIEEIIGNRRARAFLFQSTGRNEHIEQLFDARLLHILRKNVSSHDQPGVRYDVYKIDYGCYVELANTTKMPQGLFEENDGMGYVVVPRDDYRSIRRAILHLD